VLARAKNTSVERLAEMGLVYSEKGVVHLFDRSELPEFKAEARSSTGRCLWMLAQYLCQFLEKGGVEACAMLCMDYPADAERARSRAVSSFTERTCSSLRPSRRGRSSRERKPR
jgi:putative DNA methylase